MKKKTKTKPGADLSLFKKWDESLKKVGNQVDDRGTPDIVELRRKIKDLNRKNREVR